MRIVISETLGRQVGRRKVAELSKLLSRLQFFLNLRVFMRGRRGERVGKTPKQLMTGQAHAHWLELLGFQRLTPA